MCFCVDKLFIRLFENSCYPLVTVIILGPGMNCGTLITELPRNFDFDCSSIESCYRNLAASEAFSSESFSMSFHRPTVSTLKERQTGYYMILARGRGMAELLTSLYHQDSEAGEGN
jgi:hypothetical protein